MDNLLLDKKILLVKPEGMESWQFQKITKNIVKNLEKLNIKVVAEAKNV
tara:strand:- start:1913 stop:2059 length:147 start_codon:yes stop_codon:yes gene_type:complete